MRKNVWPLCWSQQRSRILLLGTLRSNDADGNENVKKTIGLISKTTTLHVHHTFLYISFPFLHDYDVKMANFAFYGGRKQATTKFYFSYCLLFLDMVPRNSTPGGFASVWQNEWVGIIAIKTERTQIHFLSDVLIAVASLDLKVPIILNSAYYTHALIVLPWPSWPGWASQSVYMEKSWPG